MFSRKLLATALLSAGLLSGCGEGGSQQNGGFVPVVAASKVAVIDYQPRQHFVGRTEAAEDVSIVPQVSGYLQERYFEEGQLVEAGQKLFQIDSSIYVAKVASAKAAVAQAKASLTNADLDWVRGKDLLPRGGVSQSEFDRLTAVKLQAKAQVTAANAQLEAAEVDLSHTTITAPFAGRISLSNASLGDLVSPQSGVLTTIVSLEPMHASFSMSEKQRLALGVDSVSGSGDGRDHGVEVILTLGNGKQYPQTGKVDYIGNRIDLNTGTIALRASFPNAEHRLLPGQYVQVEIRESVPVARVTIPRRAVQSDLEGDYVMVLAEGNVAERRNVKLGPQADEGIIVLEGLKPKESVLVKGLQRVRNGMTVRLENAASQGKKGA